ncbi:MAG: non-ribosomal peptide synthetase, partial [Candidatus Delongbacteria bacterium]|nr:non-ribosomal peptide synthetase [Candidatus Delongbacteria bacterium]
PLTPNGKIDRKALPDFEIVAGEDYIAPRNEVEEKLVEIWSEVLKVKEIGINDNFFSLGGDSIKTIQIQARLSKVGYKLAIKDIFNTPTIGQLSTKIKLQTKTADQTIVTGKVLLTPIQEWFFTSSKVDIHHFNHAVMLSTKERLKEDFIVSIFTEIQRHHDALRMTYNAEKGVYLQKNEDKHMELSLDVLDLTNEENPKLVLLSECNKLQSSIDLSNGQLLKLGLFRMPDGDRLLIVIHHLVVDGVSWRIIFEDIETLYQQYKSRTKFSLPLKSTSFKLWSKKLNEYSQSDKLLKEKDYWHNIENIDISELPADYKLEEESYLKDRLNLSFSLSKEETDLLLKEVNNVYNTEINDVLITGLGYGLKNTFGYDRILVSLEGHGREDVIPDIDISRTIGWFTTVYPISLDMSYSADLSMQLKEVKESLHQIPNKGIGYGILKYLTPDELKEGLEFKQTPQIEFNYLGQFDAEVEGMELFSIASESSGESFSLNREFDYNFSITGI